jgi:hypothetical protein
MRMLDQLDLSDQRYLVVLVDQLVQMHQKVLLVQMNLVDLEVLIHLVVLVVQ